MKKKYLYYAQKSGPILLYTCCSRCEKPGLFKWYSNKYMYSFSRFCKTCANEVSKEEDIFCIGWDIDKFIESMGPKCQ